MIDLKPIESQNLELIRSWRNSEEVSKYMYTDQLISAEQQKLWFKSLAENKTKIVWEVHYKNEIVGVVSLNDIDQNHKRCFWGFYIGKESARVAGLGPYVEYKIIEHAFNELSLNKICCEVLSFNEAVILMHEKFGFRREGYFRQHIKKANKFHDVVTMGLTKRDWKVYKPYFTKNLIHLKV